MKNTPFLIFILFIQSYHFSCSTKISQNSTTTSLSTSQFNYQHPIPFNPQQYVCYRTPKPLKIDGKANEKSWQQTPWMDDFVDIEGSLKPAPALLTQTKMLWDNQYLYCFAKMEEPHIWGNLRQRDTFLFLNDDFEIFIDPDGDSHHYYEIEVNALNTVWDLWLDMPYRVDNSPKAMSEWNISGLKTAVHLEGTLNNPKDKDQYWTVEMAIPWKAIKEFAPKTQIPKSGDQWRINLMRVDWKMDIKNGRYSKAKNANGKPKSASYWVWSPQGKVNMHCPETWGYVQFTDRNVGSNKVAFQPEPDEAIKWALWQMYFQQLDFYKKNKRFSADLQHFTIPKVEGCKFEPVIYVTPYWFEIVAKGCEKKVFYRIRKDGQIQQIKN